MGAAQDGRRGSAAHVLPALPKTGVIDYSAAALSIRPPPVCGGTLWEG